MDWIELNLRWVVISLSYWLNPVALALERLGVAARGHLDRFGVGYAGQSAVLTTLWMLAVAILVLSLSGWLRLVAVLAVAAILAKVYGVLPEI